MRIKSLPRALTPSSFNSNNYWSSLSYLKDTPNIGIKNMNLNKRKGIQRCKEKDTRGDVTRDRSKIQDKKEIFTWEKMSSEATVNVIMDSPVWT